MKETYFYTNKMNVDPCGSINWMYWGDRLDGSILAGLLGPHHVTPLRPTRSCHQSNASLDFSSFLGPIVSIIQIKLLLIPKEYIIFVYCSFYSRRISIIFFLIRIFLLADILFFEINYRKGKKKLSEKTWLEMELCI